MQPAVAAGHPATTAAGIEILLEGGTAADAAVAAALASCVAETVMTGLLGGGHGIYWDVASGRARGLDCFVAVPGLGGPPQAPELVHLEVPFGEELVHYAIGASSCAVPGVPAGLDALWRAYGKLPWQRLVEPALRLARDGVTMPPAHASCLAMLAPVMTMREGGEIYAPGGSLLAEGELLRQPGLVGALELVRDEGAAGVYTGSIAAELLALVAERGGAITAADLSSYAPAWSEPERVRFGGREVLTRGGLSGVPATLAQYDPAGGNPALLAALEGCTEGTSHTTNLAVVDAEGNACVLTTSLGLGSGDFVRGLDLHLNSMLGETDLIREPLAPGARMGSMMAPSIALDDGGVALAIGAAGGTRLRSALLQVTAGILDEGLEPQAAVDRPRRHRAAGLVPLAPGLEEQMARPLGKRETA